MTRYSLKIDLSGGITYLIPPKRLLQQTTLTGELKIINKEGLKNGKTKEFKTEVRHNR